MSNSSMRKHTLWLREGDWDYLTDLFHASGISTSLAVRSIVARYVDDKRAEEAAALNSADVKVDL